MPIKSCTLPDGGKGWQWGDHGTCYRDRADAEKQAEAAYANGYAGDSLAFDRSMRSIDANGFLHVSISRISKATVNPYYGREIPGHQELGLNPDKIYQLYRAPEELEKGAATFNNLPLLSKHVPVSAADPQKELTVGSTGTDAEFTYPYLTNSLVVTDAAAIAGIESKEQCEISCSYRYLPVMVSGVTDDGTPYDGIMTQIVGNHVALVEMGRAGPDVVVSDEFPFSMETDMKKQKRLAALTAGLIGSLDPKLDPKTIAAKLMLAMDEADPVEDDEEEEEKKRKEEEESKKKAEDDESEEERKKKEAEGGHNANEERDEKEREEDKKAMDAAIAKARTDAEAAAVKRMQAIAQAEKDVRPIVGEVAAMDSAEAVYKFALNAMGVDVTGIHPSAYRSLITAHSAKKPVVANDSAPSSEFWKGIGVSNLPERA